MSTFREDTITGDQVIIAPERLERPNALVKLKARQPASSGEDCPFCPGNEAMTPPEISRIGDESGWRVRVVPNKYAVVAQSGELRGRHEVIIETREHAAGFAAMTHDAWVQIVAIYIGRCRALEADPPLRFLALFKNDGIHSGQSIDHPHSQLIELDRIPARHARMLAAFAAGRSCPVCKLPSESGTIFSAGGFVALAPEASILPYQVRIAPWRHQGSITEMSGEERTAFVHCLRDVMRALALKFQGVSFNWFFHQDRSNDFHWFLDIFPRLTTLGGFELGSGVYINPIEPSSVAETLAGITAELRGRT